MSKDEVPESELVRVLPRFNWVGRSGGKVVGVMIPYNVGSRQPSRLWKRKQPKGSEKGAEHADYSCD
jgi:hypothetical protein